MPHVVHSASPRRSPIPGSVAGGRLLLAGASHGDDGHQSAKVPRGSQEGGFPPQLKGIRPPSNHPSARLSAQQESTSSPP